jgi:hypothetical protein
MRIKVDIDSKKILASRGLGSSNKVRKYVASEVARLSDKYVPMSSGSGAHMKKQRTIASDGSQIVYPGPYAHYLWYGKVMAGRAPKKYTGDDLTYNGAPMRGARWTERMLIDKRAEIENNVEKFIARG